MESAVAFSKCQGTFASMRPTLDAYVDHLRALPFVRDVTVAESDAWRGRYRVDAVLRVATPTGERLLAVEMKGSNFSRGMVDQAIVLKREVDNLLVVAPVIGAGMGELLVKHGVNFIDLRGNCYLDLGGEYVAHVVGRGGPTPAPPRALRAPSYQVLFALLAEPSLVSVSERALATVAGVSRQPAVTVRKLLLDLGYIVQHARGCAWVQSGQRKALDLWLSGYLTTLRPSLLVGTFRTPDSDPDALERRIEPLLDELSEWRWGGGAACSRLTSYFRGEKTVVHIQDSPLDVGRRLKAIPSMDGPLIVLRSAGSKSFEGASADTVHPLLVYAELVADGGERALDAAQDLRERFEFGVDR